MSSPRKKPAAGSKSSTALLPAVPTTAAPRNVPFITVSCSSYSQLFSTLCRPSLFLSAAAAELTTHLQQRIDERLADLQRRREEGAARQTKLEEESRQQQAQQQPAQGEEEKEQTSLPLQQPPAADNLQTVQWAEEKRQLDEEEQRLQADVGVLSHTTDQECLFDLRSAAGQALRLHEQGNTGEVREHVAGAGEYTLLVARRKTEEWQVSSKLSFGPLSLAAV